MGLFGKLLGKNKDAQEVKPEAVPIPAVSSAAERAALYKPASALLLASYKPALTATLSTDHSKDGAASDTQKPNEGGLAAQPPAQPVPAAAVNSYAHGGSSSADEAEDRPDTPEPASPLAAATPSSGGAGECIEAVPELVAAANEDQQGQPSDDSLASESSVAESPRVDWAAEAVAAESAGTQLSARRQIRQEMGIEVEARLLDVFLAYASLGATSRQRLEELDSARFYKLCRECGLLCRRFTRGCPDVAFTSAKKRKESRRLTFGEFCTALRLVAFCKQCTLQQVVSAVAGSSGPVLSGVTTAEAVRLYDDLSTYTGVQLLVATEAAFAAPTTPTTPPARGISVGSSCGNSLGPSGAATPNVMRRGSLAELALRQDQLAQGFLDPLKAAAEAEAAVKRRRQAEAAVKLAESEARAAVLAAARADEAAQAKLRQAVAAAAAAETAIADNSAAAERAKREAAALHVAAAAQQEAARAAERTAADALRKAAEAERTGEAEAEAALAVATAKEHTARDAATNAWAAAAAASEAAEVAAAAAQAAESDGFSEEGASQVAAAQEEAEAAAMAAILAARKDAEAAMIDALMQAEAAEAIVEAARAEAAAAEEAVQAAKAEIAALLAAAAAAEAAAETNEAAKGAAQARAAAAKEAATAAAVARRQAAARAKRDAEKAAVAADERRQSAAAAAQQAADAAVRAQAAVSSRIRAQQKLADALSRARAHNLAAAASAALSAPSTPQRLPLPAAAVVSPQAAADASAAALEAAQRRFGEAEVTAADLKAVWLAFATFGKKGVAGDAKDARMEGALFAKLCMDSCLVDGSGLTVAQVDLTFGKVSDKSRSISFKQFLEALPLLAAARGCTVREVKMLVAAAGGPVRRGTTPLAVRFHP